MAAQMHTEAAGTDFDKWLDWNGTADAEQHTTPDHQDNDGVIAGQSRYPISPTSIANSDHCSSAVRSHVHTAPSSIGPLTPGQSSGSPELYSISDPRLSADTLLGDRPIYRPNQLKRRLSSGDEAHGSVERVPRAKATGSKRPHNVIEKRYRANLNDKIAELRDSVPSLRVLQKARDKNPANAGSDNEDLDGLTPTGKLNKASILTKAVEYIRHLEFRNRRLEDENQSLKERLQTLDRVLAKGGANAERATAFTTDNVIEQPTHKEEEKPTTSTSKETSRGTSSVPESWKRMRQNQSQEHYGHVYQNPSERSRLGGKWTGRIMLGSLAGLMVMEGFSESNQGTDSREKGLFGIPLEILDGWTFLRSPRVYLATFAEYCHAGGAIPLMKGFLALSILAFFVFAYLFNSKPHPEYESEKAVHETPQAARPASPIQVRRRAWSTSMQALQLPHHSFFPEWLAVTSEWINYTIRYLLGPQIYARLTGRSIEDETARAKAWDIAIDAQLAGGDMEISRSRVVLTIFGSGTLPQTPMRLIQKALHCKLLLWNVGLKGTTVSALADYAATYFANRQWRRARQLHERMSPRDADRLPGYLNYLLQMDCDEVFNQIVTQRASNLMYDRPTADFAEDALMDVVVDDHAIRSPLDAIAAWRSTCALHEALDAALQNLDSPNSLREHIQAALEIAPPGSAAETRALAVHAVLSSGRRSAFYSKAQDAMAVVSTPNSPGKSVDPDVPYFIDSSTPASARPEIAACLQCARVMLTLEQERNPTQALSMMSDLSNLVSTTSSTLTTAPLFFVLTRLWRTLGSKPSPPGCSRVATELIQHFAIQCMRNPNHSQKFGTAIDFLRSRWDVATPSQTPLRRDSNVSNDTGYASLSEVEEHVVSLNMTRAKSNTQFDDSGSTDTVVGV